MSWYAVPVLACDGQVPRRIAGTLKGAITSLAWWETHYTATGVVLQGYARGDDEHTREIFVVSRRTLRAWGWRWDRSRRAWVGAP